MNNKQFLLTLCFSTGLLLPQLLLGNKIASGVTLKSALSQNQVETNLTVDFPLEAINLIPLSNESLLSEIISRENLLLSKSIEFQINPNQEQIAGLFNSLFDSLQQLEINQENNQIGENTVPILPQTDYSNVFQGLYDFETELTNDFPATPRNIRQNLAINPPERVGTLRQEILSYTNISYQYQTRFLDSNNTIPNQTYVTSFVSQNERTPTNISYYSPNINLLGKPYSIGNALNLDNPINTIENSYQPYNTLPIASEEIETTQFNRIPQPSIPKTPAQIELEKRIEKQREKLEKRAEKLRKRLEKQREKREKQRAKEREKRAKEREKRLNQIAKQQAKLREINF